VRIRVLGSAAGGGFPQWNCNCRNCDGVRRGTVRALPRTQSSIAVQGGASRGWALVNASPDILQQLRANPLLHGHRSLRDSGIVAVVLADGQIDHTTGLYMLREASAPWLLWCTDSVYEDLTQGNPLLRVLGHYCGINRQRIEPGEGFSIEGVPAVRWRALAVASKPAPYSPHRESPRPGDNIALELTDESSGRRAVYAPGLGAIEEPVWQALRGADCVLVDGTFWTDDEMIRLGISRKSARSIGHLPQSGSGGMLEWLERLPAGTRRILIHINNTNPILDEDSPERARLAGMGIEVACDGMEITL